MSMLVLPIGERSCAPFLLPTRVADAVAQGTDYRGSPQTTRHSRCFSTGPPFLGRVQSLGQLYSFNKNGDKDCILPLK
jgi:hypothetical protein